MSQFSRSRRYIRAFSLIELCVVMTVIVLLVAILLPSLSAARESARTARCLANMHQIAIANQSYSAMFNDFIVPAEYLDLTTDPKTGAEMWYANFIDLALISSKNTKKITPTPPPIAGSIFYCPNGLTDMVSTDGIPNSLTDPDASRAKRSTSVTLKVAVDCWYGMNGGTGSSGGAGKSNHWLPGRRIPSDTSDTDFVLARNADVPSDVVLFYDGFYMNQMTVSPFRISGRHNNNTKTNILFAGGYARTVARKLLPGGTTDGTVSDPSTIASDFQQPTLSQKFGTVRWVLPNSVP